jgi:hypothetical protein
MAFKDQELGYLDLGGCVSGFSLDFSMVLRVAGLA